MDRSLVVLIVGLVLWYAVKYAFKWEYNTLHDWQVRLPYAAASSASLVLCSVVWLMDACTYALHSYASTALLITSIALAMDILDGTFVVVAGWTSHPSDTISPGHAACVTALTYLNGAALGLHNHTVCSSVTSIAATWLVCLLVALAEKAPGGYLQRKNATEPWTPLTRGCFKSMHLTKMRVRHNAITHMRDADTGMVYQIKRF